MKRRSAILVSSLRHLNGDMGDELKSRAVPNSAKIIPRVCVQRTFLKHGSPVHLQDGLVGVFVFLSVAHDAAGFRKLGFSMVASYGGHDLTRRSLRGLQPTDVEHGVLLP